MKSISINFEKLTCVSVLRQCANDKGWHVNEASPVPGRTPVHVTQAQDTLYVPELKLQIVDERIVPEEVIHGPWTLDFERERDFQGRMATYRAPFEVAYSGDEVCILSNSYSANFFHWITEELVKVVILEENGFRGRYVLAGLPRFAFEFMRLLGVADERIISSVDKPTMYRSAAFVTTIDENNALDYPEVYLFLRDRILGIASTDQQTFSRRVWMARGVGTREGRCEVVNAEEINSVLARHAFDIIDMASLPLHMQIAVSRDAEILAGPHGAAFVHTLFMRPKSMVLECFSPLFINPSIFNICRIMQHKYSMLVHQNVFGGYPYGEALRVNCSHLELVLQGLPNGD